MNGLKLRTKNKIKKFLNNKEINLSNDEKIIMDLIKFLTDNNFEYIINDRYLIFNYYKFDYYNNIKNICKLSSIYNVDEFFIEGYNYYYIELYLYQQKSLKDNLFLLKDFFKKDDEKIDEEVFEISYDGKLEEGLISFNLEVFFFYYILQKFNTEKIRNLL